MALDSFQSTKTAALRFNGWVLFLSIALSAGIHSGAMYLWKETKMHSPVQEEEMRRAHVTPENLPPVQIDMLLQATDFTEVQMQSTADHAPDAADSAEEAAADLPEKVEAAVIPQPTLPLVPTPSAQLFGPDEVPAPQTPAVEIPKVAVRQEVLAVPQNPFTEVTNPDPQWTIDDRIVRIPDAPDLAASTLESDADSAFPITLPAFGQGDNLAGAIDFSPMAETPALDAPRLAASLEAVPPPPEDLDPPPPAYQTLSERDFLPIDDRLSLTLNTYTAQNDPYFVYYRLNIHRRPTGTLPILPKDVIFIQDISGSIGGRRLAACKDAMKAALFNTLRAGDRFNVFAFRDKTLAPVRGWVPFNPETREKAEIFIDSLRARGNTDLFLLLQDLRTLPTDPTRPLMAIIVTDGAPTVGVTETTRIIGEFTRLNAGNISVYTFGVEHRDPYFLDMLTYANRGENTTANGRLSTMVRELTPVFESIRNPVLKNPTLQFDTKSRSDIHPRYLTHLYADRPLTIYGRVPRTTQVITCQLRGEAESAPYDAMFSLDLSRAKATTDDLRKAWAERAMFDLLSDYASNPSPQLLKQIDSFSGLYKVPNPYHRAQ